MPERNDWLISRRRFLKTGGLAGGAMMLGGISVERMASAQPMKSDKASGVPGITVAGYPFDHVQPLIDGRVQINGCNTTFQQGKIGDLNTHVFSGPQELEVTEVGLSPFMLAYANEGFRDYSLIPVFPLRLFRHKSVFIHADRGIKRPEDLKGRRIGTPGYSSTSLTWIRGFMQHEYGVKPEDVEWVVSAADSSAKDAGKVSKQESVIPDGISISVGPEGKDESDMLVDGDVDALFHAAEPTAFTERHPKIRRLFADSRRTERDYYARTGIFPIMHAVAVRNDVIDAHPWLPEAVFNAYSQAKQMQYEAMRMQWIFGTLPWYGQEFEETRALMGDNFWPYGIDANRKTMEALFQYSYEQGLAKKPLTVEELFHPASLHFTDAS
ncbi:MAG: ABC transporter substrate-binding protein [Thiogranum sp.]